MISLVNMNKKKKLGIKQLNYSNLKKQERFRAPYLMCKIFFKKIITQ